MTKLVICYLLFFFSSFSLSYILKSTNSYSTRHTKPNKSCYAAVNSDLDHVENGVNNIGVVLLAGGKGKRMKSVVPKQFLPVLGKPVFLRSLDIFLAMKEVVSNIVIVLDESYRQEYSYLLEDQRITWADPGAERQDSVYNGLMKIPDSCKTVAIHDAARPLVTVKEVMDCLRDGLQYGAAVLGVPMKATVKESADGSFVLRTVPRSRLWEVHTPQVASKELLMKGFAMVKEHNIEVTDDVSVIEALNLPVKLTLGEYTNIKLTTPEDLQIAEQILSERAMLENVVAVSNKGKDDDLSFGCPAQRYRFNLSGPVAQAKSSP